MVNNAEKKVIDCFERDGLEPRNKMMMMIEVDVVVVDD